MQIKVAIYCRLSEEDKNKVSADIDSNSIQNQKTMLSQYAEEQNWEIYDIYSDDDYTGSDRHRPEFNRLLKDAEEKKFDVVLCKTQSRFTRELELVEKYIHGLFPLWGIRFISIVDNADTANKGNKKSRQINALVNEWYLEDMSDNIRSVLTNRRQNGHHIGAFALYGYQKDPNQKGHLIIDEEAAQVVREVFQLYAQGYGRTNIARILNDRGVPNPTEYKRRKGLRYKEAARPASTIWRYFSISNMLTNEMYIGNMVQGKYGSISYKTKLNKPRPKDEWIRVEGTHEPIIDKELWDRVQKRAAERSRPWSTGKIGIFAHKVRCLYCGCTLRTHKHQNGNRYLICQTKYYSKERCPGVSINVKRLEQYVLQSLNNIADKFLDKDAFEEAIDFSSGIKGQREKLLAELTQYKKRIEECANTSKQLYIDKTKGIISLNIYLELAEELANDKSRMEKAVQAGELQLSELDRRITDAESHSRAIEHYCHAEHLGREDIELLVDYINVGRRIQGTREYPVEIHWNF